jgi:hypothetical protein
VSDLWRLARIASEVAEGILMPDISMCASKTCPARNQCYRFRAVPVDVGQSYAEFAPEPVTELCRYFWLLIPSEGREVTPERP